MPLSPSRARFLLFNAIIGRSIALATIFLDAIVFAYIVMQSDWTHAGGAGIEALVVFTVLMLLVPVGLSASLTRQQRAVGLAGSIAKHDIAHAPVSMLQAGRDGSLAVGETLHLTRRCTIRYVGLIAAFILVGSVFGVFIDSLIFKSHAIIPLSPNASMVGYITNLPPLAIITLVWPFILSAMLVLPAILSGTWQRYLAIQADDVGITVQHSGRRDVSLRWDEIEYIVYSPARRVWPYSLAPFDGFYVIGNAQRFVTFSTWYSVGLALQANSLVRYRFTPDVDAFMTGLIRILVTIQTRQAIEMRVSERLLARTRKLANIWDASDEDDDDDEMLPPALTQPRADLVAQMRHTQETVVLQPRLKITQIARKMRLYIIVFFVLFAPVLGSEALASGIFHVHDKYAILFQTRSEGIIVSACLSGVLFLLGIWSGWTDARRERFTLIANDDGITMITGKEKRTAAWNTIVGWAMQPLGEDDSHGKRYLATGSRSLVWDESPTDTLASTKRGANETFQQRAEKLHAMIAAKTNLPLLSIAYEPRKRTWWQRLLA